MVRLVGWTDNVGTPDYNLDLAKRRAAFVKCHLAEHGVPDERIVAVGRSISDNDDNRTEESRRLNRRTDGIFFDQTLVEGRPREKA